ncbi:hypothetical protein [Nocardia salmonicida]|uniref:hypothetical protein n=1 Tax=Nocardia salmonicida TaxID=53431 RepID=UPI0033D7261A
MNPDDLEESLIGFYAVRVPDESEVLWRADFHRAWALYALANEATEPGRSSELREQARTLQDRWEADPAIRREWFELTEIREAWIYEPEDMQRKADDYLMPNGRKPAAMSDQLWRSHLQARAMTGHGPWSAPEPESTSTTADVASDVDDPFITRYADRVADEAEVLWRADFARAMDHYDRGFDEDASLLPQARAIEAQWSTDQAVGPQWRELTEIHDAWIQAPDVMKQAHEVFMPGGLRPPGMSDTRWSSHMQAREMTGHGAWPGHEPTFSTDVSERHEPMTDTTGHDQADEFTTESDTEQLMRHDFTQWAAVGYYRDSDDYDPADSLDEAEWSQTWVNHGEDRWLDEWVMLEDAYREYEDDPWAAEAKRARLGDTLSPVQARSWDQARDLVVNGISRDESGLLTSHYVTRMDDYQRAEEIRTQQRTLADAQREQVAVDRDGWPVSLSPGMEAARDDEALPQRTRDRIEGWQWTPEHYRDQGASESEAMMRADFGWRAQMRQDAEAVATFDEQRPLLDRCDEIDRRWTADPEHHDNWWELKESLRNWRQAPDAMAAATSDDRTPIQDRTYEQAHQIFKAQRHAWQADSEFVAGRNDALARSPQMSSDQVHYSPENPVPSFGASVAARTSALAGYTGHGNALAAAAERQDERAGADR